MIARRGRTVFTPSNVSEVRVRFERILARTKNTTEVPFQADTDTNEVAEDNIDELDADTSLKNRIKPNRTRRNSDRGQPPRTPVLVLRSRPTRESRRALRLAESYLHSVARAIKEDERRRLADRRARPR
jgi:hypothetical protein